MFDRRRDGSGAMLPTKFRKGAKFLIYVFHAESEQWKENRAKSRLTLSQPCLPTFSKTDKAFNPANSSKVGTPITKNSRAAAKESAQANIN